MSPSQRVSEFPDEQLAVVDGNLFCNRCREELSVKLSSLKNHFKSGKHQVGKLKQAERDSEERDMVQSLQKHNNETHLEGKTLPISQQIYRVRVLKTFLKAGVPLNKFDLFRDLLQESATRLTDRSHLLNLIPFVASEEQVRIRHELQGH